MKIAQTVVFPVPVRSISLELWQQSSILRTELGNLEIWQCHMTSPASVQRWCRYTVAMPRRGEMGCMHPCGPLRLPRVKNVIVVLENVLERATKMHKGLERHSSKESWQLWGPFNFEVRQLRGNVTEKLMLRTLIINYVERVDVRETETFCPILAPGVFQ